jgi:hypothetical protein
MEILNATSRLTRLRRIRLTNAAAAFGLVIMLGSRLAAGSPEQPMDEYQVKAAFLYNFAKFVEWPVEAFQSPVEPIGICILGQDPFGRSLEDTLAGRVIESRSLVVRHISSYQQNAGCHILFIGAVEIKRAPPMLADIRRPGILTVGDSDSSGADGVVICFRLESGKVRFVINLEAAAREKVRISSRLLNLAKVIKPDGKQ